MTSRTRDDVTYLSLVPEAYPAELKTVRSVIGRWLGLEQRRARKACLRAGHLPVRTVSGTDCQRCDTHWSHL